MLKMPLNESSEFQVIRRVKNAKVAVEVFITVNFTVVINVYHYFVRYIFIVRFTEATIIS